MASGGVCCSGLVMPTGSFRVCNCICKRVFGRVVDLLPIAEREELRAWLARDK